MPESATKWAPLACCNQPVTGWAWDSEFRTTMQTQSSFFQLPPEDHCVPGIVCHHSFHWLLSFWLPSRGRSPSDSSGPQHYTCLCNRSVCWVPESATKWAPLVHYNICSLITQKEAPKVPKNKLGNIRPDFSTQNENYYFRRTSSSMQPNQLNTAKLQPHCLYSSQSKN